MPLLTTSCSCSWSVISLIWVIWEWRTVTVRYCFSEDPNPFTLMYRFLVSLSTQVNYLGEAATVLGHDGRVRTFQFLYDFKALVELGENIHHRAGEQSMLRCLLELRWQRRKTPTNTLKSLIITTHNELCLYLKMYGYVKMYFYILNLQCPWNITFWLR